ncbi:MAG: flagellar FlbD family protein [Peptococcaceae bacterium]|nr:flagellar FlbD family protein [Peptococcaceae bacterium]
MIKVTRLNGKGFVINTDLIKTVEETPDTVIKLTCEDKFVVAESAEEIVSRVIAYRRACTEKIGEESS